MFKLPDDLVQLPPFLQINPPKARPLNAATEATVVASVRAYRETLAYDSAEVNTSAFSAPFLHAPYGTCGMSRD